MPYGFRRDGQSAQRIRPAHFPEHRTLIVYLGPVATPQKAIIWSFLNVAALDRAIQKLFTILQTWPENADLTLELNAYGYNDAKLQ